MSLRNYSLVAIAAAALGVDVLTNAAPVCEGMLDDLDVTSFGVAEISEDGRVLVIVGVTAGGVEVMRPVCNLAGDVRIYSGADGALSLARRANMGAGVLVKVARFKKVHSAGDPVAALKRKLRELQREAMAAAAAASVLADKITAAVALGWGAEAGTVGAAEYADLMRRQASIAEFRALASVRADALGALIGVGGGDTGGGGDDAPAVPDAGGDAASAGVLVLGVPVVGEISAAEDLDWYAVNLNGPAYTYEVDIVGAGASPMAGPCWVQAVNQAGEIVWAAGSDWFNWMAGPVQIDQPLVGPHYITVTGVTGYGVSLGGYSLTVRQVV